VAAVEDPGSSGNLANAICKDLEGQIIINGDFSAENRHSSIENDAQRCAKIRFCTFSKLSSADQNGGAICFSAAHPSFSQFCDCQFFECFTSRTGGYGGAMYLSVSRIELISVCGASCYAAIGAFLSAGGGDGTLRQWIECREVDVCNCCAEADSQSGAAIEVSMGPFEMRRVNFSDCKQNSGTAIFHQSQSGSLVYHAYGLYLTCFRCSGSNGFCLRNEGEKLSITIENSIFVGISVSNAFLDSLGSYIFLIICDFIGMNGELFKVSPDSAYVVVWGCRLTSGTLSVNIGEAGGRYTNEIVNYPNTVTLGTTKSALCYMIYWLPSDVFTDSIACSASSFFSDTTLFSGTNNDLFKETGKHSESLAIQKSSLHSDSDDLPSSAKILLTENFSASGLFSQTDSFSSTAIVSETAKCSTSAELLGSVGLIESRRISISGNFSETRSFTSSSFFSETIPLSFSNRFRESATFSQSLRFNVTQILSKSSVLRYSSRAFLDTLSFSMTDSLTDPEVSVSEASSKLRITQTESETISSKTQLLAQGAESGPTLTAHPFASTVSVPKTAFPDQTDAYLSTRPVASTIILDDENASYPETVKPESTHPPKETRPPVSTQWPVATAWPQTTQVRPTLTTLMNSELVSSTGLHSAAPKRTEARETGDEGEPLGLLLVSIILLVVLCIVFSLLMYKETHRKHKTPPEKPKEEIKKAK
jgi:hypothetical protein